jgi:hypothetical protein
MSDEDRAGPVWAEAPADQQPRAASRPAESGGLAERAGGGGQMLPVETVVLRPGAPGGSGGGGTPGRPGGPAPRRRKTVPRPLFYTILCLFLVALVAIAGLVVTRPKTAGKDVALRSPAPRASAASSTPGPSSSPSGGPATPGSASPPASAAGSSSATAAPDTSGVNLFNLTPVQNNYAFNLVNASEQIGNTTYPDSVRFTCSGGDTSLIYDVAGYKFLTATAGVPSNATNAAGNTMEISFFSDGSTRQLGKTVTIALDAPAPIHLNLAGTSQLEIACTATSTSTQQAQDMDVAFGNAVLTQS